MYCHFFEEDFNILPATQNIQVNHYHLGGSFVKMKEYRL